MPQIICLNGHEIEVQPEQLGERVACPACQLVMFLSPPRANEPIIPKYEVLCDNGHVLRVKSKYLGTQIRCPQCQGLAWVTTDRLQRLHLSPPPTKVVPVVPVVRVVASPPVRLTTPQPVTVIPVPVQAVVAVQQPATLIEATSTVAQQSSATAPTYDDIPLAAIDDEYTKLSQRVPMASLGDDDAEEEVESTSFTKAERRNMKLADQGLAYITGGVLGYCAIQMAGIVFSFLLFLVLQGISSVDAFQTLGTISDVIGWILFIALVLNTLLYVAGSTLALFTPWITGATIWLFMSLGSFVGFLGWRLFLVIRANEWKALPASFALTGSTLIHGKLFYFIGETLFLITWLLLILALWQLGKYARKPMTRQRVLLLGMLGASCALVMAIFPLVGEWINPSKAAIWVLLSFRVILTIGIGILLIIQHLNVIGDVRAVVARRK